MPGEEDTAGVPGVPWTGLTWSINPRGLIYSFDEDRSDVDASLKRFEQMVSGQGWPTEQWATALRLTLSLWKTIARGLSQLGEEAKLAFLQEFRFTAEGHREIFRYSKPHDGEIGRQCYTRLFSFFFYHWLEMRREAKRSRRFAI